MDTLSNTNICYHPNGHSLIRGSQIGLHEYEIHLNMNLDGNIHSKTSFSEHLRFINDLRSDGVIFAGNASLQYQYLFILNSERFLWTHLVL